jgi:hypothetical protein
MPLERSPDRDLETAGTAARFRDSDAIGYDN